MFQCSQFVRDRFMRLSDLWSLSPLVGERVPWRHSPQLPLSITRTLSSPSLSSNCCCCERGRRERFVIFLLRVQMRALFLGANGHLVSDAGEMDFDYAMALAFDCFHKNDCFNESISSERLLL